MNESKTNTPADIAGRLAVALPVILELHAQRHTSRYIAKALDLRRIPTLTTRACGWDGKTVFRLIKRHAPR